MDKGFVPLEGLRRRRADREPIDPADLARKAQIIDKCNWMIAELQLKLQRLTTEYALMREEKERHG